MHEIVASKDSEKVFEAGVMVGAGVSVSGVVVPPTKMTFADRMLNVAVDVNVTPELPDSELEVQVKVLPL